MALMYIGNDFTHKTIENNLHISDCDKEILKIELLTKTIKSIVSCCYKPAEGNWKIYCNHLQEIITDITMENKLYSVSGDFNLNCLEFHQISEIR